MRPEVQWLIDYISSATCEGELMTAQTIIKTEKADGEEYTKEESIMQMLRDLFKKKAKEIHEQRSVQAVDADDPEAAIQANA